MNGSRLTLVAATLLVAAVALPAQAQRLSLAERVERLEQQSQSGSAVELVNRLGELQAQVQALQGQVEELRHELEQARQRNREQYLDLDSRLARLEGSGPAAGAGAPGPNRQPDIELGGPAAGATASAPGSTAVEQAPSAAPLAPEAAPGDPALAMDTYNVAFTALKDGRYAEAARRFQGFIDQYPDHELTSNAYYWLGESYYVTQNYAIAEDAFETLLARFPQSSKAPDALLKVGYSQYELRQWDQAEVTLKRVVEDYPDTTVARLAEGRLRALRMEPGR